jgi:glycogen operon protein
VGPGGYQVGSFPWQWAEWNGRYRDALRRFWRGDRGLNGEVATRIAGSSDLYERSGRRPFASVNFITAHDGFTLQDLVSYEEKHNEENKEGNEDGHDHNYSTNCGTEGPSEDATVVDCRERRKRGLMASLLLSQGVPMILGGDELSHTRRGNNNPYCQDNEISWYDWDLNEREEKFLEFVQRLTAFRKEHPSFRRRHFLDPVEDGSGSGDVLWWHPEGREMASDDWEDESLRAFGYLLRGQDLAPDANGRPRTDDSFLVLMNQGDAPVEFQLPEETNELQDVHCAAWYVVSEVVEDLNGAGPFDPGGLLTLRPRRLLALRAERGED